MEEEEMDSTDDLQSQAVAESIQVCPVALEQDQ